MPDSPVPQRGVAVLAIDLQNEYRGGAAYPVEGYDGILARVAGLMAAARSRGVPVVHVQAWIEEADRQAHPLREECSPAGSRSAVAGSAAADICGDVAPLGSETVIRKRWPSAFRGTRLDDHLKALGIEYLVAVGVWTDSCVRDTVFDAGIAGYRVFVVKDACGSATDFMHRTAILDMANRLYGGGILRHAEALAALRGEPHAAWCCARPIALPYTSADLDALYDGL